MHKLVNCKKRLNKFLVVVSILLVSAVVFEIVARIVMANEQYVEEAEQFLRSSSRVKEKYGEISNVRVAKLTSVSATPTSSPYKMITFYISGDESGVEEVIISLPNEPSADDSLSMRFR